MEATQNTSNKNRLHYRADVGEFTFYPHFAGGEWLFHDIEGSAFEDFVVQGTQDIEEALRQAREFLATH